MVHKRNITVAAILGSALLGSLIALGSDSLPRPKPVAPPPESESTSTVAPVAELPKLPTATDPKDLLPPILDSEPPTKKDDLVPLPILKDDIQRVQHVEPKTAPKAPELPLPPPVAPIAPTPPYEVPPPPKIVVIPDPIKPEAPAAAKPWTPGDTELKPPPFPGTVDITPIPPATSRPPAIPTSQPSEGPESAPSHFKVKPRPQQPAPAPVEQQPTSPPPVQQPMQPPMAQPLSHNIPYFQPVRSRPQPNPIKAPGPLKLYETARQGGASNAAPGGPELHAPGVDPALGASTPQLTVEKRGPLYHKVGGPLRYQIVLRNVGAIAAQQVRLEDEVPGSQLISAQPATTAQQGDRLVWILPALRPGEERTFIEEFQPMRPGDVVSATSVHVYASANFRTKLDGDIPMPTPLPGPSGPGAGGPGTGGPILSPSPPTPGAGGPSLEPGPAIGSTNPLPLPPTQTPPTAGPLPTQPLTAAQIPMTVEVKALPIVGVGQKLVFEVIVTNKGSTPLTGMMLYGKIPAGFHHPEGPNIGADLPDMLVGETKSFKMPITALAPGKYMVEIRVTAKPHFELVARPVVTVEGKGMSIQQQSTTPRLQVGKENEIKIVVANDQPTPVSQVHITDVLPEGLEFLGASDRGTYQASSRTITWLLESVPPGETRTISLKVQPKVAGSYPHEVTARAADAPETKSSNVYQVESHASLRLDVLGRDGVMEQGRETVYAIRITNGGNSTATNVQASVTLSPGMEPSGFAQAPTAYRVNGKEIVFAPLPRLQAGETRTIHLGVRALAQGPQSVRVQVVSDQVRTPLTREERTQVYREK